MSATFGDNHLRKRLEDRLEAEMADRIQELAKGMAGDWADYRYRSGYITGLSVAMDMVEDEFQKMNDNPRGGR